MRSLCAPRVRSSVFSLQVNLYVASVLCIAGLVWFARIQGVKLSRRGVRGSALLAAGGITGALCGCDIS